MTIVLTAALYAVAGVISLLDARPRRSDRRRLDDGVAEPVVRA